MNIEFKTYQDNAVAKLKREVNELLDAEGDKVCNFKSPTGPENFNDCRVFNASD